MEGVADVAAVGLALQRFSWADYFVFVGMLAMCALIGVYFGYLAPGRRDDEAEYLMGGRKMQTLPIAMSLVARQVQSTVRIWESKLRPPHLHSCREMGKPQSGTGSSC